MKTKLHFIVVLLLITATLASAKGKEGPVISGNSMTDLGNYSIVKSEVPMVVESQELTTYDLMYENASNPVKVGILEEKKCTTFLVRSAEVEVQYVCQKGVFGARRMEPQYRELPDEESDAKLNKVNYYAQRIISQNPKTEKELLGLIACYFPVLVEKQYQAQL